jgi:hypothetical protein
MIALFLHDVPPDLPAEALQRRRDQSPPRCSSRGCSGHGPRCRRSFWGRDDCFFPAEFLRRVGREQLGTTPDEMGAGHAIALSCRKELADRLRCTWSSGSSRPVAPVEVTSWASDP